MIKHRIEEGKIRFLVTGATGFVGRALVAQLVALGHAEVLALTRQAPANPVAGAKYLTGGDLSSHQPRHFSFGDLSHTEGWVDSKVKCNAQSLLACLAIRLSRLIPISSLQREPS